MANEIFDMETLEVVGETTKKGVLENPLVKEGICVGIGFVAGRFLVPFIKGGINGVRKKKAEAAETTSEESKSEENKTKK
jgi:ABC-type amino acid transport system permease subunit